MMDENRKKNRIATDLPATLVAVLETSEGRIIDLSESGAQISGASFPAGHRLPDRLHGADRLTPA